MSQFVDVASSIANRVGISAQEAMSMFYTLGAVAGTTYPANDDFVGGWEPPAKRDKLHLGQGESFEWRSAEPGEVVCKFCNTRQKPKPHEDTGAIVCPACGGDPR